MRLGGDYAATLSSYLVQEISGQPYAEPVAQHIFQPLGMTRTTPEHNIPTAWRENMVLGYEVTPDGEVEPTRFFYVQNTLAGAMRTTASDMSRFMIGLLDDGGPILQWQTARLMFEERIAVVPSAARSRSTGNSK